MDIVFSLLYKSPHLIHHYLTEHIFPQLLLYQNMKLSASGVDLGGDMLFAKRLGFSGTPSDLLPLELGRCCYEKCSDGQMFQFMTSPDICSYQPLEHNWNVHSILRTIATSRAPVFNALIDTGALITGMTNLEVATFLLDNELAAEGVVFLDEADRKMILVKATRRVMKLEQCGISLEKRFAFYDDVHTTGMDIKHVSNACAALTLGKDMTFRDYAQGIVTTNCSW